MEVILWIQKVRRVVSGRGTHYKKLTVCVTNSNLNSSLNNKTCILWKERKVNPILWASINTMSFQVNMIKSSRSNEKKQGSNLNICPIVDCFHEFTIVYPPKKTEPDTESSMAILRWMVYTTHIYVRWHGQMYRSWKKGVSSDNITDIMIHVNGTAIYFFSVSAQTSLKCTHDDENGMMNSRDVT